MKLQFQYTHPGKLMLIVIAVIVFSGGLYSHVYSNNKSTPQRVDEALMYKDDYQAAEQLQAFLRSGNKLAIADLIDYPLSREDPLTPIYNRAEFMQHWGEYFDDTTTAEVLAAQAEEFGWRGIALSRGIIWFRDGKIIAINIHTDAYKKSLQQAKDVDSQALYASARGYDQLYFQCATKTHSIRAQYHGNDLRYFAWRKPAALSHKPELELTSGIYEPQGSGGNYSLTFNHGAYQYTLEIGHRICADDCNDHLVIMKRDKKLSRQICK